MLKDKDTDQKPLRLRPHNAVIENRERMSLTGVAAVESFNEREVKLTLDQGGMTIYGQGLHMNKLNLEDGQLSLEGIIEGLEYSGKPQGGLMGRLFK